MGNPRVMLLAAVTVIIGMYAVKIKQADETASSIRDDRANEYQALELCKTGFDVTVGGLVAASNPGNVNRTRPLLGGSVMFVSNTVNEETEKVTSTTTFGGVTRTMIAYVEETGSGTYEEGKRKKKLSRWETTKVYVKPYQVNRTSQGNSPIRG